MHVILAAEDSEVELRSELQTSFRGAAARPAQGGPVEADFILVGGERLPFLAFARQLLPDAQPVKAESVRAWAHAAFEAVLERLPEAQPWSLHIAPCYGPHTTRHMGARAWHSLRLRGAEGGRKSQVSSSKSRILSANFQLASLKSKVQGPKFQVQSREQPEPPAVPAEAGQRRCNLIRETILELLRQKQRHLIRNLRTNTAPFAPNSSLVQLLLTSPANGFLSVAAAPTPFEQRHLISPFPKGEVPIAIDKAAPSRAFAKLVEAEARLGHTIRAGETCVDLGAAPGSWTYMASSRRAQVVAVDRSPLRSDLMSNPLVHFISRDAFRFRPRQPVDWLLCDLIAPAERTSELLVTWLRSGWCRKFIVTLKLKDEANRRLSPHAMPAERETSVPEILDRLKRELPPLVSELYLNRLSANKKEICAFGVATVG